MFRGYWSTFLLFFGAVFTAKSLAEQCIPIKGYKSCACRLNKTKGVYNLQPLAPKTAAERPRFSTNDTHTSPDARGWHYSYNPCDGFDMFNSKGNTSRAIPCKNVAVGRWTSSPPKKCTDLGDPKSADFKYSFTNLSTFNVTKLSNLSITFTSLNDTLTKNQAVIYLVCNANMTYLNESTFQFLAVDNSIHTIYYFALESKCACPNACGKPPEKGGSKGGSTSKDTWLIIGVSIGAIIVLLLVILAVICCRTKRSGYTSI